MRYYIIAGERSGDLHGSNLIKSLKNKDQNADIRCFGGDAMEKAGGHLAVHYRDLAFMGLIEVLVNFRKIFKYLNYCKKDILQFKPDVVILIDYAGFNLRIAKFAYKNNIRVFYYITPKVWAWKKSRTKKIKAFVDHVFVVLPFEKEFFQNYNLKVDYVGNPTADAVKSHKVNENFKVDNDLPLDKLIIALLPGSRKQELKHLLPVMLKVASEYPDLHFVIGGIKSLPGSMYSHATDISNISVVYEQTYDLLAHSHAALVTSGTATLETALWNVPQVVIYKTNPFTFAIGSRIVLKNIPFFSLVNLMSGKEVVAELLQDEVTVNTISSELEKILNTENRHKMLDAYNDIKNSLGERSASETTANLMIEYLKN